MSALVWLLIGLPLGLGLGFLGTLTGIGGGFVLLPLLVLLLPDAPLPSLALVSLTVVVFNALSGTVLALNSSRLRLRTGLVYGLVSLPAVWWGTQLQARVQAHEFHLALGVLLLVGAALLVGRPAPPPRTTAPGRAPWLLGAALSLVIGFASGFFALGGGFLFLPLLIFVLRYPVEQASATTQMMVGMGSLFALALQLGHAALPINTLLLAGLVAGVLLGSPLGSAAALRWSTRRVLVLLAGLLAVAGVKFLAFP